MTRHVFDAFDRVEIGLALLTLILAGLGRPPRGVLLALGLIWLVVAAESLWLLPILDARVELVLAGEVPPAAPWHRLYGDLELLKLRALLALGVALLWRPRRPASRSEVCPSRASRAGSRTRSAGGSET